MTTQDVAPALPAATTRTYAELVSGEVRAECARREITQRDLAKLLGMSQQAVSDRWRGRTPWSLNETERLEGVLGLARGALLVAAVRPKGFEPPTFWFGADPLLTWADVTDVDALELAA